MDAPTNPSDAGIMFTSTKFDYVITTKKKGGWDILITLKDVRRTSKLRLDIFANGSAYLQATVTAEMRLVLPGILRMMRKNNLVD